MAASRGQGESPPGDRVDPPSSARVGRAAAPSGKQPAAGAGPAETARRAYRPPEAGAQAPSPSSRADRTGLRTGGHRSEALSGWGTRPARLGPVLIILGALAGMILTILAGASPGTLLGLLVIAATVAGGFAVRPGSVYLIIPFPAPAYFVAAVIAGLIHDRALDTSTTALALNFTQWIAGGFLWMLAATMAAIAITIIRWLMTGQAAWRLGGAWDSLRSGSALRGSGSAQRGVRPRGPESPRASRVAPGSAQRASQARSGIAGNAGPADAGDERRDAQVRSGKLGRDGTDV
jgi:hypothetical protein